MNTISVRTFAACLSAICASSVCIGQDWTPQGSINSRQYEKQIREGGQVTATEFFSLEYSVSTWIEELGDGGGPEMVCTNKCKGKVHDDHSKCDFSCDERCTETHRLRVKGEYFPDRSAMNAATAAANALARGGGGTSSPSDWSHRVSSALAAFRREANQRKTFTMEHAGACALKSQTVDVRTKAFHVRGVMTKTGFRMSRGIRTPISEVVGMHESVVATGKFVQDEPKDKVERISCRCLFKLSDPEDYNAMIESISKGLDELIEGIRNAHTTGAEGIQMKNKAGENVDPGESKITVTPADMNRCEIQIENGTGQDVEVLIPVGTTFVCTDKSVQDMGSVVETRGTLYAGETRTFYVSLMPQQRPTTVALPLRWACLNMEKKEPTPAHKFVMKPPQDDILIRLGALTNQSRIRGPHDQARVWIYTDKARFDDVNKRLFPSVSEGRYATLLWQAVTIGGLDITDRDYQKCLEPKLLSGVPLDDRATAWLVSEMAATKARDLSRYINSNVSTLARLMDLDPTYGPGHVATLATALLNEDNTEVQMAGVKLVGSIPDDLKDEFANAGGLSGLRAFLVSGRTADATTAVNTLIAYPKELSAELLGATWEQLPSDALKEKARKHLGIEDEAVS